MCQSRIRPYTPTFLRIVPGELFATILRFLTKTSTHSAVTLDTRTPRKSPMVALSISASNGVTGPSFSYARITSTTSGSLKVGSSGWMPRGTRPRLRYDFKSSRYSMAAFSDSNVEK